MDPTVKLCSTVSGFVDLLPLVLPEAHARQQEADLAELDSLVALTLEDGATASSGSNTKMVVSTKGSTASNGTMVVSTSGKENKLTLKQRLERYSAKRRSNKQQPVAADQPEQSAPELQAFLVEVEAIQGLLGCLRQRQDQLQRLHGAAAQCALPAEARALRGQLQDEVDQVGRAALTLQQRLRALDAANEQALPLDEDACSLADSSDEDTMLVDSPADAGPPSELRQRLALTAALKTKLAEQMQSFDALRRAWAEEERQDAARALFAVTGQRAGEEEVDQVLAAGGAAAVMQRAILAGTADSDAAARVLAQVEERHSAVAQLEASLEALHQMFMDMAVVVDSQAQAVDNIACWVSNTRQTVAVGLKQLRVAKNQRKRTAHRKALAFTTGAAVAAAGAAATATGVGGVVGVPAIVAGAGLAAAGAMG